MKRRGLTCAVVAFAFAEATPAAAQEQVWLRDRRYGEGTGIRAGDIEIHPGIAGEVGYDSNYFLRAGTTQEPTIDTFRLRITPSLSVATIGAQRREAEGGGGGPPKVGFRAAVAASYNEFIAPKSENSDIMSNQRNIGAIGSLQLTILPQRPFGGDVSADFARTVQPSNNPDLNFNRFTARFGGGLVWTPGGGMFDWRIGYEYGLTFFEDANFDNLSSHYHQVNTRGRWRFLPRTALLYDATAGFIRYNTALPGQLNSDPIRARIGINGLVTSSFALLAMVGWGSSFYRGSNNPQQFDGPIAQAELKWFVTPSPSSDPMAALLMNLSTVAIGYTRDFANSYLGDYYVINRGYANLSYFLGGRFTLSLAGGVSAISYPNVYDRATNPRQLLQGGEAFTTIWVDGSLFGEYRLSNSFGLNATVGYSSAGAHLIINDQLKWNRFAAFLGVRWFL
jgi:hypothetical protein